MLLFSALPMSASANDESTDKVASKIVREVVELREESVKHFLCEDGSYIAVSYAEPVHYEKNGEWLEIDNTLVLSSENTYVPKSSDLAVSIPQSFSGGGQITATNDGHTISFGVASGNENVALSKTAAVKAVEALPSIIAADVSVEILANAELSATATVGKVDTVAQIEAYNSEKTTVDNQAGALVYDKLFPNADLEYIVTGNSIKENVVVYQPQTEYVYTFDMDFGGLTPVAQEDGSYKLVDSAKPEETVFVFAAPYMYDANGEESYEVEMSLTQNGGNYLLTLTADEEWINSSERAFPVVIDPTVYYDFDDVFVMDGLLNQNTTKINKELRVGRNLTNLTRTYIKTSDDLNIELGSHIIDASLILHLDYYYEALNEKDISIQIYDCKDVSNWTATSVTWNNQPFGNTENSHKNSIYNKYRLDSISVKHKGEAIETYRFNITEAVRNWIMTGVNKGFMLASSNESSKIQIDFHSSRSSVNKPLIQVNYTTTPTLSTNRWGTGKDAATSPEIFVNTTASWTATANQPWITLSTTSGTGVAPFTVSVTENPSANHREGTVTVTLSTGQVCTLTVWQGGSTAYFSADKDDIIFGYKGTDNPDNQRYWADDDYLTKVVDINTNYDWTSRIEYEGESTDWLTGEKDEEDGNLYLTALGTNTTNDVRKATVFIESGGVTLHEINVTQLDEISSHFSQLNPDGSASVKSSEEYNHPLAQWAMALSYAAYNPIEHQALPLIPSSFMQTPYDDKSNTAKADLLSKGFEASEYNYDENSELVAAHTIGHREIVINENSEQNTTGGIDNDRPSEITVYDSGNIDSTANQNGDRGSGTGQSNVSTISTGSDSELIYLTDENSVVSDNESYNTKQLVVVVVRGSVTAADWSMNFATQFNTEKDKFYDGMQMVYDSLYGYEECDQCNDDDPNCKCNGYLALNSITDPIILVTGHSLGAAIANLFAAKLNYEAVVDEPSLIEETDIETDNSEETLIPGSKNIFAYTFATPNVIDTSVNGEEQLKYNNIFNFLNTNDVVPCVPRTIDLGNWDTSTWARHGRDFYFTMPLDINWLPGLTAGLSGLGGHAMPTYYTWINTFPLKITRYPENITIDDLEYLSEPDAEYGFLTRWLKVSCPVTVALYDTDGNIVPFESVTNNAEYPKISETGIVSWITDNGDKFFVFPYGAEDIEARITAYDYGTMTLTVEQPGLGEPIDTITYNNVNLYPDKEFKVNIDEEFSSEDVALVHVETDEDGNEIETEITDLNPYLISASVNVDEVAHGQPCTITIVTHKNAIKTQIQYNGTAATVTFTREHDWVVSVVPVGDTLVWTIQPILNRIGEHVFDVNVKVGSTWYHTEKVFPLTIT